MDTPTERVLRQKEQAEQITDRLGRSLAIRRLTALDKLRLFKAAGPVLSENGPWMGLAVLAASVSEVDGIPLPFPGSETQIEGLIARLGEEGLAAVAELTRARAPSAQEVIAAAGK